MGLFQKTSDPSQAVPGVKWASDYASLNDAFSSLEEGDLLFVNPHPSGRYTLTQTAEITQRNVQIIGMGGRIRPTTDGVPSPLIRIKNISTGGNRRKILLNIVISGLRIENDKASTGAGTGIGLEILQDPAIIGGSTTHVRLDDLYVENFHRGVTILNAFDITINNPYIQENLVAIRCEATLASQTVGQVRLFGGFLIKNSHGLSIDGVSGSTYGQFQCFGTTFGHQRTGGGTGPEGVFVDKWTQAILIFGCSFEDLKHGVIFGNNIPVNAPFSPYSQMSIAIFGSTLHLMQNPGGCIDTNSTNASIASIVSVGNNFGPNTNQTLVNNIPRVHQGLLIAGNTRQDSPVTNLYPERGYVEHSANANDNLHAYRVSPFPTPERPSASLFPIGTVIFNTTTKKLNTSDGSNWRDENGNLA